MDRRMRANSSGCGGRSAVMKSTNSARERGRSASLKRRSKPIVEDGLPLIALPQAEPAKWPGYTSRSSGSASSFASESCSLPASLREASSPCRSGRPAEPTNSVSPVSANHGSGPRVRSPTR